MKTTIIQLEAHDDVVSTRDKMTWGKTPRILLVWPKRSKILRRKVDLLLVQRQGQHLGAQVGLVTRDLIVRGNARQLGIPVFRNARKAQQQSWTRRPSDPKAARRIEPHPHADPAVLREMADSFHGPNDRILNNAWARLGVFVVGLLAVIVLGLFFYPSARVEFAPKRQEQRVEMMVRAGPEIKTVEASGSLPAAPLTLIVEDQQALDSTGTVLLPDQFAAGKVIFTNLTNQAVDLPSGTVLRTVDSPPVRFETTTDTRVPAGPGQTAEASVQAELPGSASNLEAGTLQSIEGDEGLRVSVTNPEALRGGTERTIRAPSEADYQKLKDQLLGMLRQSALADAAKLVKADQQVLPESLDIVETLDEQRDPPHGQPGDRQRLTMRVKFSVWSIQTADLERAAQSGLDANLPKGYEPVAGSIVVKPSSAAVMDETGALRWKVRATRTLRAAWNPDRLTAALRGRTPEDASRVLAGLVPLEGPAAVTISPAWWKRMPYFSFRVEVVTP